MKNTIFWVGAVLGYSVFLCRNVKTGKVFILYYNTFNKDLHNKISSIHLVLRSIPSIIHTPRMEKCCCFALYKQNDILLN